MKPQGNALLSSLGLCLTWVTGLVAACFPALAGGGRLDTLVVLNTNSTDSLALGNYYAEVRGIPAENLIRIGWQGSNIAWTSNDFALRLQIPLQQALAARALTGQISQIALSMDIPFQTVRDSTNFNSTTSALFYGPKLDLGNDPGQTNSYAASESVFSIARPQSAPGPAYLATLLTGKSLAEATALVNQGVAADSLRPAAPIVLAKSSDPSRNIRYPFFDNTILNVQLAGGPIIYRTNSDAGPSATGLLGFQTGLQFFSVPANTFVSGALADDMTSFSGIIFGGNNQSNLLGFIAGGAAGSYGTVAEPTADWNKFPNPMLYFYQRRGFNLAECYYQSVNVPYLGLTVGDPLSAPFALPGKGSWGGMLSNSIVSGTLPLHLNFLAHDSSRPLNQIDLFVDGKFYQTITNVPPTQGNLLSLSLNGYPLTYSIPANATLATIAENLAALVNESQTNSATQIRAIAVGDRVELRSLTPAAASPAYVATDTFPQANFRVRYLTGDFPPPLAVASLDRPGGFGLEVGIPAPQPYTIQASTNLSQWESIWTNAEPGLQSFMDADAKKYAYRFYRVLGPPADVPPKISATGLTAANSFQIQIESQFGQPCAILVSTNQQLWSGLVTNMAGGVFYYEDPAPLADSSRFYRAWLVPSELPALSATIAGNTTLLRVDQPLQPYIIDISTNGQDWVGLTTNFSLGRIQLETGNASGSGTGLTTFLRAARPVFANPEGYGYQNYTFFGGLMATGAWSQMVFTRTNGDSIALGVTNLVAGANATNLAAQLFALINSTPLLQLSNGVVAEDYYVNSGGQAKFNLRSRSAGLAASQVGVAASSSGFASGVTISPSGYQHLNKNLADLQPRNHLYVTAGAIELNPIFSFDSTRFPDGYHELTAVGYEGSHIRTQTHATVPICISNSPLAATLTLLDLTNGAPANATYHIQVAANTNDVTLITLYSTGGPIGSITNNASATFDVVGTNLWIGRHPFYATVETASGEKYRTETSWIRLQ